MFTNLRENFQFPNERKYELGDVNFPEGVKGEVRRLVSLKSRWIPIYVTRCVILVRCERIFRADKKVNCCKQKL